MTPTKKEIEEGLDDILPDIIAKAMQQRAMPGYVVLFENNIRFKNLNGQAEIPDLPAANVKNLILQAETDRAAFDAISYVAGIQIAAGFELSLPLRAFVAPILMGEVVAPVRVGRPGSEDTIVKVWAYLVALFVKRTTELALSRNDQSKLGFSACDAVAEAFSRGGRHMTYDQVRTICYHKSCKNIRRLAKWIGHDEFADEGPNFEAERIDDLRV